MTKREDGDEDVPKIGRGKHKLPFPRRELFAILTTITALILVLALRKPCAQGVSNIFKQYAPPPVDAGATQYIPLPPGPPPATPSK